jgi:hypothetical protein
MQKGGDKAKTKRSKTSGAKYAAAKQDKKQSETVMG